MKKRLIGLMAGMLMGTMAFSGLSLAAEADITGDWYLTLMQMGDEEYDPSMFGMEITLTLNEDGSAQVDSFGEVVEGTWTEAEEGWTLDADGEMNMTLEDDTLVLQEASESEEEVSVMKFGREKPEVEELGALRTDVALEDFNGTWTADAIVLGDMRMPADMLGGTVTITIEDGVVTYSSVAASDETEAETEAAETETEDEYAYDGSVEFTVEAEFVDGALVVAASEETGYTGLKLQLHEDGSMTDGYEVAAEAETEADTEAETEADTEAETEADTEAESEEEDFGFGSMYTIYVRAE